MRALVKNIQVSSFAGAFAKNKDIAKKIREQHLMPALADGEMVVLDYIGVRSTTQSFTHAVISEAIRLYSKDVLDRILFKNCSETVRKVITIVVEYMQRNLPKGTAKKSRLKTPIKKRA